MDINHFLEKISSLIWGNGLVFLLLTAGLLYTIRLKFIQLRLFPFLIKKMHREIKSACRGEGVSQFRTVCMSLGTAMGVGNITGVASALILGGPGAIFWMWVSAFLGMALVYAENYLAVIYRKDSTCCGPIAYLRYGAGSRGLSVFFAVCCTFVSLGMGGMVQVSTFNASLSECCEINPGIVAAITFFAVFVVVSGGAGRIGSAAQILLPLAALCYTITSVWVIVINKERLPQAVESIFSSAFHFESTAGGFMGFLVSSTVSAGIRRGVFSNEAGLGSSPILHSPSCQSSPELQGMCSMLEVFLDTIVCCTLTALVLLTASPCDYSVSGAFSSVLKDYADIFLTVETGIFAFCTIIGWYFCGETSFGYIFGKGKRRLFTAVFSLVSSLGAVFAISAVWSLSDIFNGLMAVPNLLSLFLLVKKVKKE